MSKEVIELILDDGSSILVEGEALGGDGLINIADEGQEPARGRFAEALKPIQGVINTVMASFKQANVPDEINLEFEFKFSTKDGVIKILVGEAESTFKVGLKWVNDKSTPAATT